MTEPNWLIGTVTAQDEQGGTVTVGVHTYPFTNAMLDRDGILEKTALGCTVSIRVLNGQIDMFAWRSPKHAAPTR